MKECLFDVSSSTKNFGIDENGLLTCNEADFGKTHNPYVNLVRMPRDDNRIQAQISVVNEVKEALECQSWFIEAINLGKLPADFADRSKPRTLSVGGFGKDEILKAAYVAQSIRFGEHSIDYISAIIKSRVDGNDKEVYNAIKAEILKDMPEFKYPALQEYDPESLVRMVQVQRAKYQKYITAFNRRFHNIYSKMKDKVFDAASDKLTLLSIMSESKLEFLEEEAKVQRAKKKGSFDVNDFIFRALQKNNER